MDEYSKYVQMNSKYEESKRNAFVLSNELNSIKQELEDLYTLACKGKHEEVMDKIEKIMIKYKICGKEC